MDFAALIYHRQAFLDGQWWLPLSAQIAHFNSIHALANLAGALLLFVLFRPWLRWSLQCAALAGGVVGVAMVVMLDVHCDYYAGASGALHGWAAGGAIGLVCPPGSTRKLQRPLSLAQTPEKLIACAVLLGLTVKLAGAALYPPSLPLWGFPVYAPSHWAGTLGGFLGSCLACSWVFRPSRRNKNQ